MQLNKKRILVLKPSSLGDIVHTLPLAHALKRCFPDSSIGWIVQQSFAPLLQADDAIDTVHPIHIPSTSDPLAGRTAWLQALRATLSTLQSLRKIFAHDPYDLILDLHASFRSGLLGRTNPGGLRLGFEDARELNTFFQQQLIAVPATVQHALAKNLLFADHLGFTVSKDDFYMRCGNNDRQTVQLFLDEHSLARETVLIYANPAARWQTKFWPADHWAELADRFADQGMVMLFGGSSDDADFIETICSRMKTEPVTAAGRLTLPESLALIQRSSLYVGLDSGPMHMAALSAVPVVALFGPTHPERVGPHGVAHRIVRCIEPDTGQLLACLECRKRSCSHLSCMKGIAPATVLEQALSLLHSRSPVHNSNLNS
jgi:lipopolysaccharide heptosyltransferase I